MELFTPAYELVPDSDRHKAALSAIDKLATQYAGSKTASAPTSFARLMEAVPLAALIEDRQAQAGLSLVLSEQNKDQPPKLKLKRTISDSLGVLASQLSIDNESMCAPEEHISTRFFTPDQHKDGRMVHFFLDPAPSEQTARLYLNDDHFEVGRHHDGIAPQSDQARAKLEESVGGLMQRLSAQRSQEQSEVIPTSNPEFIKQLVVDGLIRHIYAGAVSQDVYPGIRPRHTSGAPFTKPLMRVNIKGGAAEFYNYKSDAWEQDPTGLYKPVPKPRPTPATKEAPKRQGKISRLFRS